MTEPILAGKHFYKSTKFLDGNHLSSVGLADFNFSGDPFDLLHGNVETLFCDRVNLDRSIILDVDLTAGLFNDAFDVFTTGADQRSDFIRVDSNRGDSGSVLAEFLARLGKGCRHLFQDRLTSFLGLPNRLFHDPQRKPLEFEIQLEASDS